jgi:hypothetical protein
MEAERSLKFDPRDVSKENRGYDVESCVPGTGKLRFIEVKGRAVGAKTVTVTKNEIPTALNKPDDLILANVDLKGDGTTSWYAHRLFQKEPDLVVRNVNHDLSHLLAGAEEPA